MYVRPGLFAGDVEDVCMYARGHDVHDVHYDTYIYDVYVVHRQSIAYVISASKFSLFTTTKRYHVAPDTLGA